MAAAWTSWALWTAGVSLRWVTGVYQWHWRALLPASAVFELTAFLIFLRCVSGHRPEGRAGQKPEPWVWVVIAGSLGLLLALLANAGTALWLAFTSASAELPAGIDQRILALQTWGCLVPTVWGFSARWLPVFLGLRPSRMRLLLRAVAANAAGVLAALAGWPASSAVLLAVGIATAIFALRLMEPAERPAKTEGVDASYPLFIRLAYGWAAVAAALDIWSAFAPDPTGIGGASRHALTVGFLALMVFAVGQRVLPAFSGMKRLFSSKLMFAGLALLAAGCLLRVASEVLAYQHFSGAAWSWLPVSAVLEMAAVTAFAGNLWITFARPRPAVGD